MRTLQYNLHLQFGGEDVVVSQYLNTTNPVTITGATSGVKAQVIGVKAGTSTTQPVLLYSISQQEQITKQQLLVIQKT